EVRADADGVTVQVGPEDLHAERLLVAAGRSTGLDRLGLETVGLDPSEHTLEVDEYCRVRGSDGEVLADLYAIGDVTGRGPFTHMSIYRPRWRWGISPAAEPTRPSTTRCRE